MGVPGKIVNLLGGNVADAFAKIVSVFKVPPEQVEAHAFELQKIQADLQQKAMDLAQAEIQSGAEVIKAEANSQSWLPRNVRPLVLLFLAIPIAFNALVPIIARFWMPELTPLPLDPWVYKLVAIGFTGYVTARTWEKVTDRD